MTIALPSPNLEVRDLRLVAALCRAGTTGGAGEVLGLAQPTVSRALLALEERLAQKLFVRTPRGLVATRVGSELAEAASDWLVRFTELERSLRRRSPTENRIRVVCECHAAYHWLPSVLPEMEAAHEGVKLELRVEHTSDPLAALSARSVEAALVTSPVKADASIDVAPLFSDELLFVVGRDHPELARRRWLTAEDLRAHRLFSAAPTRSESEWFFSSVFGRARPRLRFTIVPITGSIVELAAAGHGIGLISEWVLGPHGDRDDIVVKRLRSGRLERPWNIAYLRERATTIKAFATSLRRHGASQKRPKG